MPVHTKNCVVKRAELTVSELATLPLQFPERKPNKRTCRPKIVSLNLPDSTLRLKTTRNCVKGRLSFSNLKREPQLAQVQDWLKSQGEADDGAAFLEMCNDSEKYIKEARLLFDEKQCEVTRQNYLFQGLYKQLEMHSSQLEESRQR